MGGGGEENDEPMSLMRPPAPQSLGRSESLSLATNGRYGGAGVGLGGDGSMGRGVVGIKEGDEVVGTCFSRSRFLFSRFRFSFSLS